MSFITIEISLAWKTLSSLEEIIKISHYNILDQVKKKEDLTQTDFHNGNIYDCRRAKACGSLLAVHTSRERNIVSVYIMDSSKYVVSSYAFSNETACAGHAG